VSLVATNSGGNSSPVTETITVNPLPTVSLLNFSAVCLNEPAFSLSGGSPSGGTYSGSGVSNNSFSPSTAGVGVQTITYSVTQNGCSNSANSTIQVDACSGILETNSESLLAYPNPTNGLLKIKGKDLMNYSNVDLIDISGKVVGTFAVNNNPMIIDLSSQSSGYYSVKFYGNGKETVQKIEIKK
jgi:hypothetical protein